MSNTLAARAFSSIRVLLIPDIYLLVLRIYFPILFPLTFLIALVALQLDALLGFGPLFGSSVNVALGIPIFLLGGLLWTHTYDVFVHGGKGSPSPAIRRTTRLVTWGIYSRCRNPSVLAKLLGVLAVGLLINSPTFTLVLVPLLLVGSLIEKVWRQEPVLVELFGEEYLEYRRRVPLFIPRLWVPEAELRGPLDEAEDVEDEIGR